MTWQPITTAPKDGTEVLLLFPAGTKRTGYWARRIEAWSVDATVMMPMPTHWLPLPPAAERDGGMMEREGARMAQEPTKDAITEIERAAIHRMFEAWCELRALGWQDAMYCPKDGSWFFSIEPGSTGVHDTQYSGEWPNGRWWVAEGGDLWPSRPCLFKLKPKASHV